MSSAHARLVAQEQHESLAVLARRVHPGEQRGGAARAVGGVIDHHGPPEVHRAAQLLRRTAKDHDHPVQVRGVGVANDLPEHRGVAERQKLLGSAEPARPTGSEHHPDDIAAHQAEIGETYFRAPPRTCACTRGSRNSSPCLRNGRRAGRPHLDCHAADGVCGVPRLRGWLCGGLFPEAGAELRSQRDDLGHDGERDLLLPARPDRYARRRAHDPQSLLATPRPQLRENAIRPAARSRRAHVGEVQPYPGLDRVLVELPEGGDYQPGVSWMGNRLGFSPVAASMARNRKPRAAL